MLNMQAASAPAKERQPGRAFQRVVASDWLDKQVGVVAAMCVAWCSHHLHLHPAQAPHSARHYALCDPHQASTAVQGAFDNSYKAAFGEAGWGAKAQERLGQVCLSACAELLALAEWLSKGLWALLRELNMACFKRSTWLAWSAEHDLL